MISVVDVRPWDPRPARPGRARFEMTLESKKLSFPHTPLENSARFLHLSTATQLSPPVLILCTGVVGLTPDTGERQRGRSQGSLSHWKGRMY